MPGRNRTRTSLTCSSAFRRLWRLYVYPFLECIRACVCVCVCVCVYVISYIPVCHSIRHADLSHVLPHHITSPIPT
jgi:hypothetical protein